MGKMSIHGRDVNVGRLTGNRLRVYELLSDGKPHDTAEICEVGGTSGMRRLRELREEVRSFGLVIRGEKIQGGNMWRYRMRRVA